MRPPCSGSTRDIPAKPPTCTTPQGAVVKAVRALVVCVVLGLVAMAVVAVEHL